MATEAGIRSSADNSLAVAISAVQSDFDSIPEDENDYISSAAIVSNDLVITRTDGGTVPVSLAQFMDDTNTDNFVTGASLAGDTLTLTRYSGNSITVNLGQYQTSSEVGGQITSALAGYDTESYVGSAIAPLAVASAVSTADSSLNTKIDSLESSLNSEVS